MKRCGITDVHEQVEIRIDTNFDFFLRKENPADFEKSFQNPCLFSMRLFENNKMIVICSSKKMLLIWGRPRQTLRYAGKSVFTKMEAERCVGERPERLSNPSTISRCRMVTVEEDSGQDIVVIIKKDNQQPKRVSVRRADAGWYEYDDQGRRDYLHWFRELAVLWMGENEVSGDMQKRM